MHSPSGSIEIHGSERHYAASICSSLYMTALGGTRHITEDNSIFHHLIPKDEYPWGCGMGESTVDIYMSNSNPVMYQGVKRDSFSAILNTAYVMGCDAIKLLARIHGQCEIHLYALGHYRAWLAEIIEEGVRVGIMRPNHGWEESIPFLTSTDTEPVVFSYSVCRSFPNPYIANFQPVHDDEYDEDNYDAFYELPRDEQWRMGMEELRKQAMLGLNPDNWHNYYFGDGVSAFDFVREYRDAMKAINNAS